jgi:hypothetical protein
LYICIFIAIYVRIHVLLIQEGYYFRAGRAVAKLIEGLYYKLESCGFDS